MLFLILIPLVQLLHLPNMLSDSEHPALSIMQWITAVYANTRNVLSFQHYRNLHRKYDSLLWTTSCHLLTFDQVKDPFIKSEKAKGRSRYLTWLCAQSWKVCKMYIQSVILSEGSFFQRRDFFDTWTPILLLQVTNCIFTASSRNVECLSFTALTTEVSLKNKKALMTWQNALVVRTDKNFFTCGGWKNL